MDSICEVLDLPRQYQIPAAIATNKTTSRMGTTIFQSLPSPAAGVSATFTALDGGDGASAEEEPDAGGGGWATGELPSCAAAIPFLASAALGRRASLTEPDSVARDLSPAPC